MQSLKEVKQSFADNSNYLHANDYLIELDNANPDGEEENILWEAGYLSGYEAALKELSLTLDAPRHIEIQRLINKLLTN